jgi:hypothetical protein
MIDEKMLFNRETIAREIGHTLDAAIVRLARRYLALRNAAKTQEGRVRVQAIFWHMGSRKDIDAAADRLLEGGE